MSSHQDWLDKETRAAQQKYRESVAAGRVTPDPWWWGWAKIGAWLGVVAVALFLMGVIVAGVTHSG